MPNPAYLRTLLFPLPFFLKLIIETDILLMLYLISSKPVRGYVFLITPTYRTTFGFAYLGSCIQLAFSVEVGPECPETFCLDERMQGIVSLLVNFIKGSRLLLSFEVHEQRENHHYAQVHFEHAV